jgi:cell division protein FtsN
MGGLFAVLVERLPSRTHAEQAAAALGEQGWGPAVVAGTDEAPVVRVGDPLPLRAAVELAEQLRARGHAVRLAAQPGEAVAFVVRHGNFDSRREAEERAADLARLGFPNHVVRVR